jgi:tRNA(fMet)-specific endonuclease VapC
MPLKVYLLDTNIASALWDSNNPYHEHARKFVEGLGENRVYISRFVEAEILYGHKVYAGSDPARRRIIEDRMRAFPLVKDVDKHTAEPYSDIRAALFSKFGDRDREGKMKKKRPESLVDKTTSEQLQIQENDLWMAALAVQHNMSLVSDDKMKRIKKVWPALDLIPWKPPPSPSTPGS